MSTEVKTGEVIPKLADFGHSRRAANFEFYLIGETQYFSRQIVDDLRALSVILIFISHKSDLCVSKRQFFDDLSQVCNMFDDPNGVIKNFDHIVIDNLVFNNCEHQ